MPRSAFITVEDCIKSYMGDTYANDISMYQHCMAWMIRFGNEIEYSVAAKFKRKFLPVDNSTQTALLPDDFVQYTQIGLRTQNNEFVPLILNTSLIVDYTEPDCDLIDEHCSCGCEDENCYAFGESNAVTTFTDVVINGTTYQDSVTVCAQESGDVIKRTCVHTVTNAAPSCSYSFDNDTITNSPFTDVTIRKNGIDIFVGDIENNTAWIALWVANGFVSADGLFTKALTTDVWSYVTYIDVNGDTQLVEITQADCQGIYDQICNLDATATQQTLFYGATIQYAVNGLLTFPLNGVNFAYSGVGGSYGTNEQFANINAVMQWLNSLGQRGVYTSTGHIVYFTYVSTPGSEKIIATCCTDTNNFCGTLLFGLTPVTPSGSYTATAYQFETSGFTYPLSTASITIAGVTHTTSTMMNNLTELLAWLNSLGASGTFTNSGTSIILKRFPVSFYNFSGSQALFSQYNTLTRVNGIVYNSGDCVFGTADWITAMTGLGFGLFAHDVNQPGTVTVNYNSANSNVYQSETGNFFPDVGGTPFSFSFSQYTENGIYGIVTTLSVVGCFTVTPTVEELCYEEKICEVEVAECGCVTLTDTSLQVICNCSPAFALAVTSRIRNNKNFGQSLIPSNGFFGEFKVDTELGVIKLNDDFQYDTIFLEYYSANLINSKLSLLPVQAEEAAISWMYWKSIQRKQNASQTEKREAKKEYYNQKRLLKQLLNPLNLDTFLSTQRVLPIRP